MKSNINFLTIFLSLFITNLAAQQSHLGLKEIAIEVASIRKKLALDSGFVQEAQTLDNQINAMKSATFDAPLIPNYAIGFNPAPNPAIININPHLQELYRWAEDYLNQPDPSFPKSTSNTAVFPKGRYDIVRPYGELSEKLIWLTLSPLSRYQFHPNLFKRLLLIAYATSDDYLLFGTGGNPDISPIDDWFAANGIMYLWKIVGTSYVNYIPTLLKERIEQAANKMGQLFYQRSITEMGSAAPYNTYCNRDISFAEILVHGGQYRNNQDWLNRGMLIVNLVLGPTILYPDGAYAYIGDQNETSSYHGATTNSLAKLYAVTNNQTILEGIARAKNYELINIEQGYVSEFYHVPAWKTQWNGGTGQSGTQLLYISGSPHLKSFYGQYSKEAGNSDNIIELSFYKNISPAPIPNNYLVYDRNIQGIKRRINDFAYGITTRKATKPNNMGLITMVGALTTTTGVGSFRDLDAALMSVQAKVHTVVGADSEWDKWVYLMGDTNPLVNMSKNIGAVSTPITLYRQTAGPNGTVSNWNSFQQWITLPDRLIGIVEIFPKNNTPQTAYQIDGRIKLGYGRGGNLHPKDIEIITPGKEYNYGNLKVLLHQHNFTTIDTAAAGVLRDSPLDATEIRLRYDLSNNGINLISYPGTTKQYFITEIRYKNATSNVTVERYDINNVKGLIVTAGSNKYAVFRNLGTTSATVNVSGYLVSGNTHKLHYSRNDNAESPPTTFTGTSITIPANEQRLLVSSQNINDNEQSWTNYDDLLEQLPGINIESNKALNGICMGESITFNAITDNLGTSTTYQWTLNDAPISGATNPTFSSSTLTNGQKINCLITTTLTNGSTFSLKSNDIVVAVSTKPTVPVIVSLSPTVFSGNSILLSATSSLGATFEWYGPNNFRSNLQNPTITYANISDKGTFTTVANIKGCYSDPATINISVSNKHVWRGTVDNNYANDDNWDFGCPKLNIGTVEIPNDTKFYPIINASTSFAVPSIAIQENARFEVQGFFKAGINIQETITKVNFTFPIVAGSVLVGSTLVGNYQLLDPSNTANLQFRWYRADDIYGTNATVVATTSNYTITANDVDKFMAFSVRKLMPNGLLESVKTAEYRKITKVNITDNQLVAPTALYSLRKLSNSYQGPAIRVRRDKDNKEMDIAFDPSGYLDTDSLLAFVTHGNAYVTKWYDQSTNNLDAVQPTIIKQPFIVKNGKLVKNNNLPALEFIGTDILETSTSTKLDAPNGFALFITAKQLSTHTPNEWRTSMAYRALAGSGNGGNGASLIGTYGFRNIMASNGRQVVGFMRNSNGGIISNGAVGLNNYVDIANQSTQMTNYCNGSGTNNNVVRINNNQYSVTETLTLASNPIVGPFSIGNKSINQNNVSFIIGEVILYTQPISSQQIDNIEKNMMKLN